jgi:hypothetical protein
MHADNSRTKQIRGLHVDWPKAIPMMLLDANCAAASSLKVAGLAVRRKHSCKCGALERVRVNGKLWRWRGV